MTIRIRRRIYLYSLTISIWLYTVYYVNYITTILTIYSTRYYFNNIQYTYSFVYYLSKSVQDVCHIKYFCHLK